MGNRHVRTMCRICEAHCGLVIEVEGTGADERVVDVKPDRAHPVSKGYACVKGTSLGDLHHDPDRVDRPLKRVDGDWVAISWDQAIREIGERVRALRADHGDRSIALYSGNPTFFSFQNLVFSAAFVEALGSPNYFASHSVDVNTKFHVSTELYGLPTVHPVIDFDHTSFVMVLGSNPAVSQMSVIQAPDALGHLRAVERRGGRVVIVDPRRTETAARVGEHVFIRPGTDAYLLFALVHVLVHEDHLDLTSARLVATGVDRFVAVAEPWTPERVESITGIPAATIRELARAYRDADGAALYLSTGVNMGPFGSLAYWALQGLNLLTGNLDRRGGLLVPEGPFDTLKLSAALGHGGDAHRTIVSGWPRVAGAFPVAALAEEITVEHPERIRALFVSAGNPLHSVPGHELADALGELDLVVGIDLYRNETIERFAHYVLPAADMLERSDYPIAWANLQPTPWAQWTAPVVAPRAERRTEWEIFSDLAVACGASPLGATACNTLPRLNALLARLPGDRRITPDTLFGLLLRWGGKVTLGELRRHPEGVPLPPTEPGTFLGTRVPTPDHLVRLAPASLLADVERLDAWSARFGDPGDGSLVCIGRRERRSHNSWMHNNPGINQPPSNTALVHPDDAARLGIGDGDRVELSSVEAAGTGTLVVPVRVTADVMAGVVVVPHGWGHGESGLTRASALGGGNVNSILPGGTAWAEPVSGQAIMLGHRVRLSPCPTASSSLPRPQSLPPN